VHTAPDRAWSDREQTLDVETFRELARDVQRLAAALA